MPCGITVATGRGNTRSRVSFIVAAVLLCASFAVTGCATSAQTKGNAAAATPTAAIDGPLASVVSPVASGLARRISTSVDSGARLAKITLTVGAAPDVATAQAWVMSLCFHVQKAVWASDPSWREVKVIVLGPIRDDYANIIDDAYGVSDVLATTAASLQWSTLNPASAWSRYDNTWLRPSYSPNWLYGKNN